MTPVLIVSYGRSGSTILSQLLNTHPMLASIQEFWSYRRNRASVLRNERTTGAALWRQLSRPMPVGLHSILAAGLIPTALATHGPTENVLLRTTLPALFADPTTALADLADFVTGLGPNSKSEIYSKLFTFLAARAGKRVWIERTGGSLRYLRELLSLFPGAKFIHLYRDGRNCALSMARHPTFVFGYTKRTAPHRLPEVRHALLRDGLQGAALFSLQKRFASDWSDNILAARRLLTPLNPADTLDVRYERLLEGPHSELRRIVRFICGPNACDRAWIAAQAARLVRPTADHETLSAARSAELTGRCAPSLEKLGYL